MVTILPILVFVHILKTRYKFRRKFWLILALCATNLPFAVWSVLVS